MKSHASMNRIYRLVWNAALSVWVAVAENAKGQGKAGSARNKTALLMLVPLAGLMHQARAADAANATVSAGAASVSTAGNTTTINQSSQRAAIDWTSLSTRANEALVFNQPNAQAIALNRITGSSPSELLGSLTANGQVFILNPNGVLFGAGSQVNVGGLVASTLSLSNADFEAGNYKFTGSGGGSVVNQGTLNAAPGGYLALLAPEVRNEGVMTASLGTALLAAGNKVTLNLDNGSLLGYSIDQGAINALAENKQLIQANGGQVLLSAKAMNSLTTATVNNSGIIEAKTVQNKAGRILLMGDMETGTVNVAGTLDASAPNGGDGGFIETSGAHVRVADGTKVTTLAPQGLTGTWLVDPTDFTISSGSGSQTSSGIGATTLSNNLANTSVTLSTDASTGSDSGDINVNAAVTWSANTRLTLSAYNNININAAITATGTSAGLVLNHGNYATAGSVTSGTDYKVGAPITLSGANATLAINGTAYTLIHSMAALDAIDSTGLSGKYALAGNLDASGTTYSSALVGTNITLFSGTFAGLGHTISNLTISAPNADYVSLVANNSGTIRDLGLVGGSVSGRARVGALVGRNYNSGSISNAYTTGSVSGSGDQVGGLVGLNEGSISNAYATGSVSGSNQVGGLVGYNDTGGSIGNAYATGSVSGGNYVGALAGTNDGTVTASFWLNSISTTGIAAQWGGTIDSYTRGLSASEATSASTYINAGWSAAAVGGSSSVWRIYEGHTAPLLRSFMTALTVTTGSVSKIYDGSTALSSSYTLSDSSAATSLILGTAAYNTSSKNVGSYAVSTIGLYSGQQGYDISYVNGTATITAATLTVSGTTAANKTYNGTTAATLGGGALSGVISGDTVALSQSGTFSDKNAGTSKTVSYSSSLSGTGAGNYVLASSSGSTTADITAATLTVSGITAADKTYNASTAAIVNTAGAGYSGLIAGDVVTVSATGSFSDKNTGAGKTVNLNSSYSGADVGNYIITNQAATTASISQAALTVTGITASDKTYNASTAATVNTAGASYSGLMAGDVVNVAATGLFSDKNAGAGKTVNLSSSYSGADVGNYAITSQATTTASISQAALTVSGITAADKTYNASDAATVNTAGAAYNGLFAGDVVSVNATGVFSDKNAGAGKTVTLASSYGGADAGNYLITGQATTTASIVQASLTLSTSDVVKTYDAGTSAAGTAVVTGGTLYSGDALSGGSFAFTNKNAGAGDKVVNVSGVTVGDGINNGNYNVSYADNTTSTIHKATLTVTGVAADNKTYDATNAATLGSAGTLAGLMSGEALTLNNTGATFADKNAGTGKLVTATYSLADGAGGLAANYHLAATPVTTTANIDKAALTVSGITASDKTYNASDVATVNTAGASYNGLFAGDAVTVAATGLFSDKNAGAGKTVNLSSTYSGADAGNYTITGQATTTASISQAALTISGITASDKTYNASDAATVNTAGAAYNGLFAGDVVSVAATGLFSDKNAGAGKTVSLSSSYSGADAGNYAITSQASTTATINQAALTVSGITAADKTYNASDAATVNTTGASYSGLFAGDVVAVNATGLFSDKNVGTGKAVTLSSTYSGADAGNYTITGQAGTTASISQAALTISGISASDKTYNASDAATVNTAGAAYNGLFAGDVVSVAATGLFSDKNAGTGKTVTLSSSYGGADAGNYTITGQATTMASISQAALTVSGITASDKTYDAGTVATVNTVGASYSGLFAGDVVNAAATGLFSDKNVGTGKTVNLSSSYSGADTGNYTITSQASTTATINKADLVVQATGSSKVYDGSAAATVALSANGLAGDVLTLTGNASFADANAGLNKAVSVTGIAVGGADAGNYRLINGTTAGTTADITPKQLTVTANNDTQFGGNPYSGGNGVSYNGLVAGDTAAAVLAGSLAYGGSAQGAYLAGEYDITPGGLLANGNYSLRFVQGKLTLSSGDAASAALGGTALVGAYQTSLNSVSSGSLVPRVSVDDSKGGGGGDAASGLNAAAAEAADQGGGNQD